MTTSGSDSGLLSISMSLESESENLRTVLRLPRAGTLGTTGTFSLSTSAEGMADLATTGLGFETPAFSSQKIEKALFSG